MKNETNKQTNKTTLTNRPLDKREQKKTQRLGGLFILYEREGTEDSNLQGVSDSAFIRKSFKLVA